MNREVAEAVYGAQFPLIERYVGWLAGAGVERGLLGPREVDRLWDRHVLNCAALSSVVPEDARVADVGSGAGLPGLPLAVLRPDLQVVLVEPLLRRVTFLDEVVGDLGLGERVEVVRSRGEDWRAHVDVVTCRAVAPLERLLGWTVHLWRPGGQLVALKGASAEDEVAAAANALQRLGARAEVREIRAHADAEPTRAIVVS